MPALIPLQPSVPRYTFSTALSNAVYTFRVYWNSRSEVWYMDVYTDDETLLRAGVPLLLGVELDKGRSAEWPDGRFLVYDTENSGVDATLDDLGTRVQLWYFTNDELGA